MARRGEHSDCHYFFDVQNDTDGLSVPGIRKWPGAGYGFSFHCWVKLDSEAECVAPSPVSPASPSASSSPATSPASGRGTLSPTVSVSSTESHLKSPASSQTSTKRLGVGNKRRQLLKLVCYTVHSALFLHFSPLRLVMVIWILLSSLLTSNNTGVEVFFRSDGVLIVAISTKKEFLTATVPDIPLTDSRWHCIGVCITMARCVVGNCL